MWRLVYFIPTYIVMFLVLSALTAVGLIIIPPMALLHKYTTQKDFSIVSGKEILSWKHGFMWLWGNDEDGLIGASEFKDKPIWFRIIYWTAWRNPVNNHRFTKLMSCIIEPSRVQMRGENTIKPFDKTPFPLEQIFKLYYYDRDDYLFTTLIWQGIYSNFRVQFRMFGKAWRFWIGWKIYAHDMYGISEDNYRYYGAGFARQLKPIYPRKNK